ncbi:mechanosensitive ion channel domain-containing protein [Hyphococcus luteus]|uniref:mechanosensitive ion channel domain-containing protein n=1 Tax=Hyphococcus luteus TaxID=2058213 RepID=UPI001A9C85F3|nr:mechanosensitive ion channel domain-containing protein [Marinicaulis flavus]
MRIIAAGLAGFMAAGALALAQDAPAEDPDPVIEAAPPGAGDADIAARIEGIFAEIDSLKDVDASVSAGVVTLSGETATADAATRAESIAARINGVVTVENEIERDVSVSTRVTPALGQVENVLREGARSLPLFLMALIVFLAIAAFGLLVSGWGALWRRITPNAFIAEIAGSTARGLFIVLGAIAMLSLLDATAFLGAFLGAAGVIGLAVGFAVRDTIENYIASIMLSLRQPFRPNDHVVIDDKEGRVIRLTSRATILMTLEGNHLRIPNAAVFKAVILNYTRNPERRFDFELGVDADDDPIAAIDTGVAAIAALDFVLKDPPPLGFIRAVGDSNIVIFFAAWIDQRGADFAKSRSLALAAAKDALEEAGFALPEPIYRLRFDESAPAILRETRPDRTAPTPPEKPKPPRKPKSPAAQNIAPDTHLEEKVAEERREQGEDLLSSAAPVE